jgi:hypothetical protein
MYSTDLNTRKRMQCKVGAAHFMPFPPVARTVVLVDEVVKTASVGGDLALTDQIEERGPDYREHLTYSPSQQLPLRADNSR